MTGSPFALTLQSSDKGARAVGPFAYKLPAPLSEALRLMRPSAPGLVERSCASTLFKATEMRAGREGVRSSISTVDFRMASFVIPTCHEGDASAAGPEGAGKSAVARSTFPSLARVSERRAPSAEKSPSWAVMWPMSTAPSFSAAEATLRKGAFPPGSRAVKSLRLPARPASVPESPALPC